MYLMIEIEFDKFNGDFKTDREFVQMLLDEEFVFCLPGECFGLEGFVRVVFAAPVAKLKDASDRMKAFCDRHRK
jgi:tyrosine aminotransferase